MIRNSVFALSVILMIVTVLNPVSPAKAWEYQDDTPGDSKFEKFGPRADKLLIKLYSSVEAEWDALAKGEIDVTDWPLSKTYYDKYKSNQTNPDTGLPYNETVNVVFYGAEFGMYMLDLNNNNNQYLGNPPNPAYPNPCYPNPTSVAEMRQAIAYLTDRSQLETIIGAGFYVPLYTIVSPVYGVYSHPEIRPGGTLENLTYPYSRASAEAKLEEGGFTLANSPDGWRYWDRNHNSLKDSGEDLELKFVIRSDHTHRRDMGNFILGELAAVNVKVTPSYGTASGARIQVMLYKDFNLYIGGWGLGTDLDYLILWNSDFYWHPGSPYNYAGINNQPFNEYSYGVQFANTFEEVRTNAWLAQEEFASHAKSVPLWCYAGNKAMSQLYTGGNTWTPVSPDDGENAYRGQYWEGVVNVNGYGADSSWSFMNMHPTGYERGGGDMTVRWGFKTTTLYSFNPVFAEWQWDWNVLWLQYDSLLVRNPSDSAEFVPWLAESFGVGTYVHPVYGTCTKIKFTLRPEATWADGTPITVADVFFTLVELDEIIASRGIPPPWWISNVANILSFTVLDPYNFEVLLDVKTVFAAGWIGENIILPKHIWKPLVETAPIDELMGFAPDPNMIGSGPWRFAEYDDYSHLLLFANRPGSTVRTSLAGSVPITSPQGYWRYHPAMAWTTVNGARSFKVDYYAQPKTLNYTVFNCYLGGPITIGTVVTHPDGTTYAGTHIIAAGANWSTAWIGEIKGKKTASLTATITDPPELAGTYNWSRVIYGTIRQDETGSTLYDDIGWSTYPFKSQLTSFDIKVDIKDIALAAKAFGSYPGHPRWNTAADDNGDYKIDIKDIAAKVKKFGWAG